MQRRKMQYFDFDHIVKADNWSLSTKPKGGLSTEWGKEGNRKNSLDDIRLDRMHLQNEAENA